MPSEPGTGSSPITEAQLRAMQALAAKGASSRPSGSLEADLRALEMLRAALFNRLEGYEEARAAIIRKWGPAEPT